MAAEGKKRKVQQNKKKKGEIASFGL